MTTIDYRHVLIKDDSGNVVGKYDKEPPWELNLPSDLSVFPIRVPDDVPGRKEALDALTGESVNWDSRLKQR